MVIVICTPLNIRNILFPASGSPRLVDAPEGGRQKEIGGIFNFSVTSGKRCEEFSISFFWSPRLCPVVRKKMRHRSWFRPELGCHWQTHLERCALSRGKGEVGRKGVLSAANLHVVIIIVIIVIVGGFRWTAAATANATVGRWGTIRAWRGDGRHISLSLTTLNLDQ